MLFKFPNAEKSPGDYMHEGILYCGHCKTPKSCRIEGIPALLPIFCKCSKESYQRMDEEMKRQRELERIEQLKEGLHGAIYHKFVFEKDVRPECNASLVSRGYVSNWEKMKEGNIGIMFSGDVGTGKTFYAACIANEIIEKYKNSVLMISVSEIINADISVKDELFEKISAVSLLILDDVGAERRTSYGYEQFENIINLRDLSGKPLVITTNLSIAEIRKPPDIAYSRAYDRIDRMCPQKLVLTGTSFRKRIAEQKRRKAMEILGEDCI